ncbi:hypothetical protein ACH5RR_034487 [Cinchona calisaya]|uniref:Uncharacterized protein n=1 Tax=Cinchona calisaya TaxID=153742 RepID=A0ABD2YCD8_9GENT
MASVDPQDSVIHPDMTDIVQNLKLLISILRPYISYLSDCHIEDQELRKHVKYVDQVVQKVIQEVQLPLLADVHQGNEVCESSSRIEQLVPSNFTILKSLNDEIERIILLFNNVTDSTISSVDPETVLSFIQCLLQNLKDVFIYRADTIVPMKKELDDIEEMLMLVRSFLWLIPNGIFKHFMVKSIFFCAQNLALHISNLLYDICFMNDEGVSDMRHKIPGLVNMGDIILMEGFKGIDEYWEALSAMLDDTPAMDEHILAFSDYLIQNLRLLLSDNEPPSFIVAVKGPFDILIEELSFLRCNLMDILLQNPIKELKSLMISTRALIIRTGLFVYYLSRDRQEDEQMARYCCFKVPDLLKAVDNLKQQASDLFNYYMPRECGHFKLPDLLHKAADNLEQQFSKFLYKSRKSDCHSNNVLEYADLVINKLEKLLLSNAASLNALKPQIATVYEEIVSMRKLLGDIQELGNSQMELFFARYRDAACQTEGAIDSFVSDKGSIWCQKLGLFVVTKDVKILHKEVKSLMTRTMTCDTTILSLSGGSSSQVNNPPNINDTVGSKDENHNREEESAGHKLVGLKDAEDEIIELLTRGSRQLKTVSIVGMPGLGKTTLANSVYKHPSINFHFHVRAWCCVSQTYEKDSLLFDIFDQIVGKTTQSHETSREDFVQKLYQSLKGRKYLIVIDDIWDIKAWIDLKGPFPDDDNGSRILFTTRQRAVALEANSIPYALRMLSPEESCELLWLKVFGGEICPPELLSISERIARNCKGLPLAVILIAGILKTTERKEDCWEHVSNTLNSSEVSDILEFSYKHLPDCLKPCFIYLGTFPEDTVISVSKLIQLWICEGFLQQPNLDHNNLEKEAENYLNDLVDRSLVMTDRRSSKGGVKACRMHDVLGDFCSRKLHDERFMMRKNKFGGILFLYGDREMEIGSLLYYHRSDIAMNFRDRWFDYGFILQYKLLRVLDLGNVPLARRANTSDIVNIAKLIQLRYLAIHVGTTEIPSEIGNLRNLETFLLIGAVAKIMLPVTIWNLVNLRHIIRDHSFFSFSNYSLDFFQNFSGLDNLKSISVLSLRYGNNVEKFILRRLTGIQKLGCRFSNQWDESTGCNLFPVLDFLSELESLKVFIDGKTLYPCKFSFPSNLKKLSMSDFRLPWDEISIIGQLPNLEVLKLLNKAFEGQEWEMREGEFQKLKFLKLDSLDIKLWNASSGQLPSLEQLVVLSCRELEEIPSSFGEIPTLQLIEMKWCSSSATDSVKQILEEQRDMSNDELSVTIVGMVRSHDRGGSGHALPIRR